MNPGLLAQTTVVCLALCGLAAGPAAAAEPLPGYDLDRFCTWAALSEVAAKPTLDAGAIRQACRQREETALDALKALWPDMPARARSWCSGQVENAVSQVRAPSGSYELLYECLLDQTVGFVPGWKQ